MFPLTGSQALCQEAVVWKRLVHDNVVPLLSITTTPLQLISEWMTGGNLTEYIEKHPGASRLGLVGVRS
jgi:serine/threonine protein kinase